MPVRRFSAAELVLTQRLHMERPLLLMVLLGAGAFALAEGSVFCLGLLSAGVLINALALWRRSEVFVPRFLVNVAVLLATAFFLLEFLGTPDFLLVLGHYLILIQLCKLFEQKRNRDYAQIMAVSLVLVLDAALLTTGLWFALLMLAYVPVACYVAMVLTLKLSLDRQATARLAVETAPADPQRLAWNVSGSLPTRRLWGRALFSAGVCAVSAVFVFLLMPRSTPGALFPLPQWPGMPVRISGFPEAFRLTDLGRITRDRRVVMQVRMQSDGKDLGPGGFTGYLRGRLYRSYHRGEWFVMPGEAPWWGGRAPSRERWPEQDNLIVQRVIMDASLLPLTFAIAPTLRVELPEGVAFTGPYPEMNVDTGRQEAPLEYTAYSFAQPYTQRQRQYLRELREPVRLAPGRFGSSPSASAGGRAGALTAEAPADTASPAVVELARQWCADLLAERQRHADAEGDFHDRLNLRMAAQIAQMLGRHCAYTLDLSQADPFRDPVEDFLFHTRRGHCQFFASAMVLMCRAVGVQARLATGFLASEYVPAAGGYLVRASDAHAWCEVFTPSSDWIVMDPTPPGAREQAAGAKGGLKDLWGAIRFYWRTRVIGYGEHDRQNLFGRFLRRFRAGSWAVLRFLRRTGRAAWQLLTERFGWDLLLSALPALALAMAVATLTVMLGALVRRRRLQRRVALHVSTPRFYRQFVKLLWRRGLRQRPDQTTREFLGEVAARIGAPAGMLAELSELLYQIRWGRRRPSAAMLERAQQTVERAWVLLRLGRG